MAEPINVPFGIWTQVGPRNHVLDEGLDPPRERAIFGSISRPIVEYREYPA